MKKQQLVRDIGPAADAGFCGLWKTSSILSLIGARKRSRPVVISFPSRRRASCLTRRAMLAALREAEFDDWQASGGDFLDSTHQTIA